MAVEGVLFARGYKVQQRECDEHSSPTLMTSQLHTSSSLPATPSSPAQSSVRRSAMPSLSPLLLLLLLVLATLLAESANSPPITVDPESQAVSTGSTVTLNFTVPGSLIRTWTRGSVFSSLSSLNTSDDRLEVTDAPINGSSQLAVTSYHHDHHMGDYTGIAGYSNGQFVVTCPARLSHAFISTNFTLEPADIMVTAGESVVLRCIPPRSNPPAFVFWRRTEDGFVYTASLSGSLYLSSITQAMAGHYQCVATNSVTGRMRQSRAAQLTVSASLVGPAPPTQLTISPSDIMAVEGEQVELECASNVGAGSVTWEPLPPSASILQPSGFLRFSSVSAENSGVYSCSVGGSTVTATLTVEVPPTAVLTPSSVTAVPDDTITFTCSPSHAEGMVDIAWFSQGAVLQLETNVNSSSRVVVFPSDKDVLWVECVMRNSVGCDHAIAVVTLPGISPTSSVLLQPSSTPNALLASISSSTTHLPSLSSASSSVSLSPSPSPLSPTTNPPTTAAPVNVPEIQQVAIAPVNPVIPIEEGSLEISCFVVLAFDSEGPVGIKWLRNGSPINTTTPIVYQHPAVQGTLTVTLPSEYTCVVTTSDGMMEIQQRSVNVTLEPVVVSSISSINILPTPSVSVQPPSLPATSPALTALPSEASPSLPAPSLSAPSHSAPPSLPASSQSAPALPAPSRSAPAQSLPIPQPTVVLNSISSSTTSSSYSPVSTILPQLSQSVLASSPTSPSPSQVVETAVTPSPSPDVVVLFIQPPVGDMVLLEGSHINITCSVQGPKHVSVLWTLNTASFTTSTQHYGNGVVVSVLQLSPVTAQHHGVFRCIAINPNTNANISRSIEINVIATAPSLPPQAVTIEWLGNGGLLVRWQPPPPVAIKSHLIGYKLNWGPSNRQLSLSARESVPHSSQQYTISGLTPGAGYTVMVWAYSLGGDGPAASLSTIPSVTIPVPSPSPSPSPNALNCSSSSPFTAVLSWKIPNDNMTLQRISYGCQLAAVNDSVVVELGATGYTLSDLLPDCSYTVTLSHPLTSTTCMFHTPFDPSANGSLAVTASWHDERDLLFQWMLPDSLEPYADQIKLEVKFGDESDWIQVAKGQRIQMDLNPYMNHVIDVRVRLNKWVGYFTQGFLIPALARPSPSMTSDGPSGLQLGLTYGFGILLLVVACVVLLILILVLKHIQSRRREKDKFTDHRKMAHDKMTKSPFNRASTNQSSLKTQRPPPETTYI